MNWLRMHSSAVQALTGIITMVIALATLIGVKVQIDASERLQREQSARDIYREFLNLSVSKPEFADPDFCAIKDGPQAGAYESYVDYLVYTGEQLLSVDAEWEPTLMDHLDSHREYLCPQKDWRGDTGEVRALLSRFQADHCRGFVSDCAGN